jgi:hypothetical protein
VVLGVIPILGFFFQFVDVMVSILLILSLMIFLSGLGVVYVREEGEA